MKDLVKSNEVENKPKNVEEAIKAGWKTAEEIYITANSSKRSWDRFIADVRNAMSQKSNSGCAIDCTANLVVKLGSSHKAYYHPKVEEAFQAWLRRNAINAGGQRTEGSIIKQEIHDIVDNSGYKYTKEDICSICNIGHSAFERFASSLLRERDFISVGLLYGYSNE